MSMNTSNFLPRVYQAAYVLCEREKLIPVLLILFFFSRQILIFVKISCKLRNTRRKEVKQFNGENRPCVTRFPRTFFFEFTTFYESFSLNNAAKYSLLNARIAREE